MKVEEVRALACTLTEATLAQRGHSVTSLHAGPHAIPGLLLLWLTGPAVLHWALKNQSEAVSFCYDLNWSGLQVGITSGLRSKTPAPVGGVKASFVVQFVVQLSGVAGGRWCLIVGRRKRVAG